MDTSRRSAWLSEFEGVDEVARWVTDLGGRVNRPEIRRLFERRQMAVANGKAEDYRLFVVERGRGKPRLEIYRRGPKRSAGDGKTRGRGDWETGRQGDEGIRREVDGRR